MNTIKQSFLRVKTDIENINLKIKNLEHQIKQINKKVEELSNNILHNLSKIPQFNSPVNAHINPTIQHINPTIQHINPTHPTDELPFQAFNSSNSDSSIGNWGVPTDKQTNRQTNRQTQTYLKKTEKTPKLILEDLDALKKEIRLKFKHLTPKEMLVFSILYQLEEEQKIVDYKTISKKLNLSESSIRDYIGRLINKKIPITKEKVGNKKVILHISKDLKQIATLSTLLKLREL